MNLTHEQAKRERERRGGEERIEGEVKHTQKERSREEVSCRRDMKRQWSGKKGNELDKKDRRRTGRNILIRLKTRFGRRLCRVRGERQKRG